MKHKLVILLMVVLPLAALTFLLGFFRSSAAAMVSFDQTAAVSFNLHKQTAKWIAHPAAQETVLPPAPPEKSDSRQQGGFLIQSQDPASPMADGLGAGRQEAQSSHDQADGPPPWVMAQLRRRALESTPSQVYFSAPYHVATAPFSAAHQIPEENLAAEGAPRAPLSPAGAYTLTLETIHRNTDSQASSSTFGFTNTGVTTATYQLDFYWPNGIYFDSFSQQLGAGESITYSMQNAPLCCNRFVGRVDISGDEPLTGTITSPDYGIISGLVYEDDGSTPVTNLWVDIHLVNAPGDDWYGGGDTLSDGRYYAGGLPDGDYMVAANPGYPWAKQWYNGHSDSQDADPVPISGSGTVTGVNFTLQPGGRITGTVYAADGVTPLENINVDLDQGWFGTCTDANGYYEIVAVPYGDQIVVAGRDWNWCTQRDSGYITEYFSETTDHDSATPVTVNALNDTATGIDFTLEVGGVITGRVTAEADGSPLANVHVAASEYDNENYWGHGWTNASGYYTITGLVDADYRLRIDDPNGIPAGYAGEYYNNTYDYQAADRVTISGAMTVTNVNFALAPGGVITGVVVDQNTGLPLANINLGVDLQGGGFGIGNCTKSDGSFTLAGIPYGNYVAWAGGDWNWCQERQSVYVREFYNNHTHYEDADIVVIDAGTPNQDSIDFSLEPGGYISGTVLDTALRAPVAGLEIQARERAQCPWCGGPEASTQTDANGRYRVGPLPTGEYTVFACTDCSDVLLVGEYYNDAYDWETAEAISVTSGVTVTGVDFLLEPGIWLTGHVTVPVGYSNEGINIDVWKWDGIQFNSNRRTDASGDYIVPVPPIYDSYWAVQAGPWGTDLGVQWAHGFDLAEHTHWDFDLQPGGVITGRITSGGAPVPNLWVGANSDWGGNSAGTDANGYYAIRNLPAGDFRVETSSGWQGWARNLYGGHEWDWATQLRLEEGEVITGINIEVQPLGQIEGYVYESDGVTPIEGLRVAALNADGFWMAWSQPDGYFTIDVPAGDHRLLFEMENSWDFVPSYYPGASKWADAVTVTVSPIVSGSLYITTTMARAATLSGQVTDAGSGTPLGGIHVAVENIDPAVDREAAWWTCTDENGDYSITGIWPGLVQVSALGTCGAHDYGLITTTLTALPGGNHTLNLSMSPGGVPPAPFTIHANESLDYTPLLSGGSVYLNDSDQILPALFAPLVQLDDQGEWFSDLLAQVPTPANGGAAIIGNQLVVTYTLKPGLLWSDGAPLTSTDIRFAWEMYTTPHLRTNSYYAKVGTAWKVERVATPDALTAVLTFEPEEFPPDYLSAILYPLPEHVLAGEHPLDVFSLSAYAHNPVGNGPYVVTDWVPGSHLDLRANPNYHKRGLGLPAIPEVRFLFTDHPFWSLANGAAQVSLGVGNSLPPDYATYDFSFITGASWAFDAIIPDNRLSFFQDAAVRKALYHALDRQAASDGSGFPYLPADGWIPPDNPMYTSTMTTYSYDLGLAASMLDAAGWVDTNGNGIRDKDGVEFEFDLYFPEGNIHRQYQSQLFQADLASIGVDANLVSMPWGDYVEAARRGKFDAFGLGWGFDSRYEPQGYVLFHSRRIPTAYNTYGGSNYTGYWQDPLNDTLLMSATQELDGQALRGLYAQQLALFTDQLPIWPVKFYARMDAAVPTLLNFKPAGQSTPVTWNIEEWEQPPNPYDLSVRKSLAPDSPAPQPGTVITYQLELNNAGYFTTTGTTLVDILPDNVLYLSAIPAPDAITGTTLSWNLGDLPGRSTYPPVLVAVQVPVTATHGTRITNTVQAFADQADTHPANNGYTHVVEVREDVDLAVNKYGVGQPAVGEHYDYYIDYANWGGAPASDVVITDTLPPEVSLLSANPAPDGNAGGVLTWTLPTLDGNQWGGQIELTAEIIDTGTVTNTAAVGSPETETDYGNNTDVHVENVDDILAPVIYRPTQGTTDGTPTISGAAPSGSTVTLYDLTAMRTALKEHRAVLETATFITSTTATVSGTFSVELNLSEGSYVIVATATKAGLTSNYSNAATIDVNHSLPLDPDFVTISAGGVDVSAGSVRANRYMLPRRLLDIEAVLACPTTPVPELRVTENGVLNYTLPPTSVTDQGGGNWNTQFRLWLSEPHSTYDIWIEWDCGTNSYQELLMYILIDPDGFLYDQSLVDAGGTITNSLLLNGVITAFVKVNDAWQVWPANLYAQTNPQVSDGTTDDGVLEPGYYSFLTPPGQYRIEAAAPGFQPYQSPVLTVITTPIHLDIGLQPIAGGSGFILSPAELGGSQKQVDKTSAWVGDILTYDLWLRNSGGEDTGSLSLTDAIPDYTEYVSGSLSWDAGNAAFNAGTDAIDWTGPVAGDATVHISYQVRVVDSPGVPFYVVNNANVQGPAENLLTLPGLSASTLIQNEVDLTLQSSSPQKDDPGQAVVYSHLIQNTGNYTDTFSFQASSSQEWLVAVPGNVTLASGVSTTVRVTLTIPAGTLSGTVDTTILTATSQSASNVAAAVSDQTTVNQVAALTLSQAAPQTGKAGTVVTYTHQLRNTGNGPDTFHLSAVSDQSWQVDISPTLALGPGETGWFEVVVHIPPGAAETTVDTTTVTVVSGADAGVKGTEADVTTVGPEVYQLFLPVLMKD